ncbi:MAG: hypothetical protein WD038_04285 [Balneolales bacterium]
MNSLFARLLKLYGNGSTNRPTEDFCTECLAGILQSDQSLLNEFVWQVLNIKSLEGWQDSGTKPTDDNKQTGNFRVVTRKHYPDNWGNSRYPDMVFTSDEVLCFLEIKVDSGEGEGQLKGYKEILDMQDAQSINCLRYCTKYIDEKDEVEGFEQFRWADVAVFLRQYEDGNQLIQAFLEFLKEKQMAGNERFTNEDMIALKQFGDVISKVQQVFESVEKKLSSCFGNHSKSKSLFTEKIASKQRLAIWRENVINDKAWSEVLIAFNFKGSELTENPVLSVNLWVSDKVACFDTFDKAANKFIELTNGEKAVFDRSDIGAGLKFAKPLSDFLEKEHQLDAMRIWIEGSIEKLQNFKEETENEIEWTAV